MTNYIVAELSLNDRQKQQLVDAMVRKTPINLKLSKAQLMEEGTDNVALTSRQINQLVKAAEMKKGATLNMSLAQLRANKKMGILKKMITGEGVFSDVFSIAKKIGGVVADKVLIPTAKIVGKVAKSVGKKALKEVLNVGCDALAVGTLTETQPELLPVALMGCNELSNAITGGCACDAQPNPFTGRGKGRPKKSNN